MQNPEFAQGFLLGLVEDEDEPMEIEEALRFSINRMGVTEFSNMIGESKSNVSNFLNGTRNLKEETLNKYLVPFNLKIKKVLEELAS
jgi:antitoxin component HigA of HigAB toxin-antitoxin module